MKAVRIHETGGPEVLTPEEVDTPSPGPGELLIQVSVAGVNYADTGLRRGMFHGGGAPLPMIPGFEVAGTVAALGEGVDGPAEGTRVAAVLDSGGYAGYAVADAGSVVEVPEGVDFGAASGALLVQGITAYGVLHDAGQVAAGDSVLVQAAAGGVGSLAVQLAKLAGAETVIGTAGSQEKREFAKSLGADYAIDYHGENWPDEVLEATGGRGADVILESVGGSSGARTYECLAPLGRLVSFGVASGEPLQPPDMWQLSLNGQSVNGFGGPWIRPGRAAAARKEISTYLQNGKLQVPIGKTFPLDEAAEAHSAIEGRATMGKVLLEV